MKKFKKMVMKHKKELIIGIVLVVAAIVCIVFLFNNSKEEDNNINGNNEENIVYEKVTEDQIVDVYGVSKEDAIALVKQNFNSDNFEYSVEISSEARYIVTVKNVIDEKEYKFEVNPMTKEYYVI